MLSDPLNLAVCAFLMSNHTGLFRGAHVLPDTDPAGALHAQKKYVRGNSTCPVDAQNSVAMGSPIAPAVGIWLRMPVSCAVNTLSDPLNLLFVHF